MTKKLGATSLVVILGLVSPACAEDPFLTGEESTGSFSSEINSLRIKAEKEQNSGALAERLGENKTKNQKSLKRSIESLISGSSAKKNARKKWGGFEKVQGTNAAATAAYQREMQLEHRIQRAKKEPPRKAFGNRLNDLEKEINSLGK